MNKVSDEILTGTVGELLVQIRLLQYGVQAAPPIKDSGNDLIAVNGHEFRAVSVKTTTTGTFRKREAARRFHVLAVVHLVGDRRDIRLDSSQVFLIPESDVAAVSTETKNLTEYGLAREHMEKLFGPLAH